MFQKASPNLQKLDPLKRVNYTFGLVLGVEEFLQSDAYFLAKHHLENRLLHGYGTVCGLDVIGQNSPQVEVQVTPGWAIVPKGHTVYVSQLMCVQVNQWLTANLTALQAVFTGPAPASLKLCVVLCSRECKTDVVPIPGEPCQTQTSSMAPSRIADSFELKLCLDPDVSPPLGSPPSGSPPSGASGSSSLCEFRPAPEEHGVLAFARLLSEIQASPAGPFLTLAQLKQLVRGLIPPSASPALASPPSGPPYYVPLADAHRFRRAAFRTWITEVRPFLGSAQGVGPCCPPPERCVLLAEIAVSLNSNWAATAVSVDDSRRPFLAPTSLLQELDSFEEGPEAIGGTSYQVVAAGYFGSTGAPIGPSYNLSAALQTGEAPAGEYLLTFAGYRNPTATPGINYIVKGTLQTNAGLATRGTFEVVSFGDAGILIQILSTTGAPLVNPSFMVEISEIGGVS
ncbi:MAG TPA: hypothetical protein VMQ86_16795 [Bryobacteraceae bacterium]|nr:hypothetical protein [Bryobacteraceae bacterium]